MKQILANIYQIADSDSRDRFRDDLYYRLNVIPVNNPLRERRDDMPALTRYFIERFCKKFKKKKIVFTYNVQKIFDNYSWPKSY